MKKLLMIGLIASSFVLGGCVKQEKVIAPEIQKQVSEVVQSWIVQTGSVEVTQSGEVNSGVTEQIQTWSVSDSWAEINSGSSILDDSKESWILFSKDLWKNFKIIQTKAVTTLSYSWNEIFKENNTADNIIIAGWLTWCSDNGDAVRFDDLSDEQKETCILEQQKRAFSVDTKNLLENRFAIVTKKTYEWHPPSYLYDMNLNKIIEILFPRISKFLSANGDYFLLYSPSWDCSTEIDLITKDSKTISQINECDISSGDDKYSNEISDFEFTNDWKIKVFYKNWAKIIPVKLK